MSDQLTIRKLVDRISSGDIRIPAFQRDFVWEPEQVAFLLDSIYKSFPIGTIILWRTDNRLKTEKMMGCFQLPEPPKKYPVNYVLDGQQRLTSLFSVFQTELKPFAAGFPQIYFDMKAQENLQESLFVDLDSEEVDFQRHFPVSTLFDTVAYRRATNGLSEELVERVDVLQSRFKEFLIPNEIFETDDRNEVAIVFERINRAGTELNVFELLAAWSWSDNFDLVEQFGALQDEIEEHGFSELCADKDLQLRVCAGIITGETTPKKILDLQGEEIRDRFEEIKRGILGALDFISNELGVKSYKALPFPGLLVPLAAFFATDKSDGVVYSELQRRKLLVWFWRSLFTRRFSSDVNQRQAHDIEELIKLRLDESYEINLPAADVKIDFQKAVFSTGNANSRALILLLVNAEPKSFLSGAKVDLSKVLKKASKHEFHHIFPRKFLEKSGVSPREINSLANIAFLTRGDNNKIKASPPSEYLFPVDDNVRKDVLTRALCPPSTMTMTFHNFLQARAKLLNQRARELMRLDANVSSEKMDSKVVVK